MLEEHDLERVPVVEDGGRLVGVLSRAVVQRRLAEDEPPGARPGSRAQRRLPLAAGVRAGRRGAFFGRGQLGRGERDAVEDVALAHLDRVEAEVARASR